MTSSEATERSSSLEDEIPAIHNMPCFSEGTVAELKQSYSREKGEFEYAWFSVHPDDYTPGTSGRIWEAQEDWRQQLTHEWLRVIADVARIQERELVHSGPPAPRPLDQPNDDEDTRETAPSAETRGRQSATNAADAAPEYIAPQDLAQKHKVNPEALRKRLDRWRAANSGHYIEVQDRKPRQPKYLYKEASVLPLIRELATDE